MKYSSPEIQYFANVFTDAQFKRELAGYDSGTFFTRSIVLKDIENARRR